MDYYRENPESYAKKLKKDKQEQKKPSRVKKRVEANKANRKAGTYGSGDGLDYDHATKKMVKASTNRGRNSKNSSKSTKGDKNARG